MKQAFSPLKYLFIGLAMTAMLALSVRIKAQEPVWEEMNTPTFKLNASKIEHLPPAMYGTWGINARLIRTTAPPGMIAPETYEMWTLDKTADAVTLKNIVSNATTSIHIDKVEGNTATFHHTATSASKKFKLVEVPTVTVEGDRLSGVNRQKVFFYDPQGRVKRSYEADIAVEGTRLSGPKFTFRDPVEHPPDFEVAPIQFENQ